MTVDLWGTLASVASADEATVELHLVLPLLALLGYGREDIAPKHSVIFKEGRRGRPHEADFAIFNGGGRSKDSALLVVEAKKAGESLANAREQAESYAANLGAPFLLCTNGTALEVWQMQPAGVSERIVVGLVADILSLQPKLEMWLRKEAAAEYKRNIQRAPLVDKGPDLSAYLQRQLDAFRDQGIERRLRFGQSAPFASSELLSRYDRGCVVEGPSGYGKSTLAASLMNLLVLEHAKTGKVPIHVWLPDAFRPGANFRSFLVDRIRAHCPAMVDSVLVEVFRTEGGWLVLDGMERLSEESLEALSTEVRLLQQDYPSVGVVLFGRHQRLLDSALPVLTLCELNRDEQRQIVKLHMGGRASGSFFASMPQSFQQLAVVPLLLVRFVKGYAESGRVPVHAEELFSDWLTLLLRKGRSRPMSQYAALTQALEEVAWITRAGPIRSEDAIRAIEAAGIAAGTFDELVAIGAITGNRRAVELIHEALADYFRARRTLSNPSLLGAELEKIDQVSDGFFPILLAALAPDRVVSSQVWEAVRRCNLDVFLQCVRFNAAMGRGSEATSVGEAGDEIVQEFAWSLDCILSRFPALRSAAIGALSSSHGMEGFSLIGQLDEDRAYLSWQIQPIQSKYECQMQKLGRSFKFHGSKIEAHDRRGRGMLLGAENALDSLLDLVQQRRLRGGTIYLEERLLSRLQTIELGGNRIPVCGYRLDDIVRWLGPHRGTVLRSNNRQFEIEEVLADVQLLQETGQSAITAWWWDHLDPESMEPRDDSATIGYFKEKYRRVVLGYKEVCEASLADHLQNLGMHRALPMRWSVMVERPVESRPFRRPYRTEATWRPVQNWSETECEVEFVDKIAFDWSHDKTIIPELARLGRYAGRHLTTAEGNVVVEFAKANTSSIYTGDSIVLTEISDWIEKDIKSLFREYSPIT